MGTDYYWREGMEEWKPLLDLVKPPPPDSRRGYINTGLASPTRVPLDMPPDGIKTFPFHLGGFLLPVFFLFYFGKNTLAMIYFAASYTLFHINSGYLELLVALPMMAYIGIKGNEIVKQSGKVTTQKAYNWHYGKWLVAGILINLALVILQIAQYYEEQSWGTLTGKGEPAGFDRQFVEESNAANRTLPKMINDFIRLDSTSTGSNRTLHYHYTLLRSKVGLDSTQLNAILRDGILNEYRTNPDLKFFRDNRVTLDHDYYDADGNMVGTVEVGPNDLQ